MAAYMLKIEELSHQLNSDYAAMVSLFENGTMTGRLLAEYHEKIEKVRHDAVVVAIASRYDIETQEMSFYHHLESLVDDHHLSIAATDLDFNKTPDLFYKSQNRCIRPTDLTQTLHFIEVAVSKSYAATVERKRAKYDKIIEKFVRIVQRGNRKIKTNHKFTVIVVKDDLSNWDSEMSKLSKSKKDENLEEACYALSKLADYHSKTLYERHHLLSSYEQRLYMDARAHAIEEDLMLESMNINIVEIKDTIDKLNGAMANVGFNELNMVDTDAVMGKLIQFVKKNWNDLETGFEKPNKQMIMKAEITAMRGSMEKYDSLELDKVAPTFHFAYKGKRETDSLTGFHNRYKFASDIIWSIEPQMNDKLLFLKDIFKKNWTNPTDEYVFFNEGPVEKWDEVKKNMTIVREPKVLKEKALSEKAKSVLAEAGVNQKKLYSKNKPHMRGKMKSLQWWEAIVTEETDLEIELKSSWFIKKSNRHYNKMSLEDETLEHHNNVWRGSMMFELENHIHTIAQNILYKGNKARKGIQILNTGNSDVWFVVLPGGDVTENRGDIRFIQIIISSENEERGDLNLIFNREIITESFTAGDKIVHVTRWMSLNRDRWLHLEKALVTPFVSMMSHRVQLSMPQIKYLCFAYMYSAYGCQSKISAILDNFRYMIPGAMSLKSGVSEYIKEKMQIAVRSHGQAWLIRKLYSVVTKYADESKSLTQKPLIFMDDELDENSGGITGMLSSPFIPNYKWNDKDYAMGEIFICFHLTGKSLHEPFKRDIEFIKDVFGGEAVYQKELKPKYHKRNLQDGFPIEGASVILSEKEGRLFCKDLVRLSGYYASLPCATDRNRFTMLINKQGFDRPVLTERLLTSTKSSIFSAGFDDAGDYHVETKTLLENTLSFVHEKCQEDIECIKNQTAVHLEKIIQLAEEEKDTILKTSESPTSSPSGSSDKTGSEESNESNHDIVAALREKHERDLKNVLPRSEETERHMLDRIRAIKNPSERSKLIGDFLDRSLHADLESDITQCCGKTMNLSFAGKKITMETGSYEEVMKKYNNWANSEGQKTLYQIADEIEHNLVKRKPPYILGHARTDSVMSACLNNITTVPIFKIVPKGQRTQKDREIFVQNSSRYVNFVEEHIAKCICEMIPNECITISGDSKMEKLKKLYELGQIWKRKELVINGAKMNKHVRYITGDMSKFSNYDTCYRLRTFLTGCYANLPKSVGDLLLQLIRLGTRKKVIAPLTVIKMSDNLTAEDPIFEIFKKCGSIFPECDMEQNWLQGMRNYIASAAHCGACISMSKFFHQLNSREFYFDFLVHSDDWAICYGYCTPDISTLFCYSFKWRSSLGIQTDKDLDRFMLNCIVLIYKLNNLTVSIKKSSISDKFVEFVSYVVNGGSCYMGYEKQLMSVFSEKPGKGTKEDCISILAQASSAVLKGADSTVVDMFVKFSLERTRHDYSMGPNERYDPCKIFNVSRENLPLAFFPDLSVGSIDYTLGSVNINDHKIISSLYEKIVMTKTATEEEKNAAKLLCTMSVQQLGKTSGFVCRPEVDTSDSIIPGFIFRPKNTEEVSKNMELNHIFDAALIKHAMFYDFTSTILKPKDFMFSVLHAHEKLLSDDILISISGRNKVNMLRARGDFKGKKSVKLKSDDGYDDLNGCYERIKTWATLIDDTELEASITGLKLLSENLNTVEKTVTAWLETAKFVKTDLPKRKVRSLMYVPNLGKPDEMINPVRLVITKELNPERFALNHEVISKQFCYADDVETAAKLLKTSGYHRCKSNMEKKQNIETVCKFSSQTKAATKILTAPKKINVNVESALKWIKVYNTFLLRKALMKKGSRMLDMVISMDTSRKSKMQCQNEIAEAAMVTRLNLQSKNQAVITDVGGGDMKDVILNIKTKCIDKSVEIGGKYNMMYAFLEKHYLNLDEQCYRNYFKEFTMQYIKKDKNWNRVSPYQNAEILVSKASSKTIFEFESGIMTVWCNYSHDSKNFNQAANFMYKKHKWSYNIDNYRYFDSEIEASKAHPDNIYMIGQMGHYNAYKRSDPRFDWFLSRGRVRDNQKLTHDDPVYKVVLDEKDLTYKIEGSVVGSLNHYHVYSMTDSFRFKGVDSYFDLNEICKEGMLHNFIYGDTSRKWINPFDICKREFTRVNDFKYLYYLIFRYLQTLKIDNTLYIDPFVEVMEEKEKIRENQTIIIKGVTSDDEEEGLGSIPDIIQVSDESFDFTTSTSSSPESLVEESKGGPKITGAKPKKPKGGRKEETDSSEEESSYKVELKYSDKNVSRYKTLTLDDLDCWATKAAFDLNMTKLAWMDVMLMMWRLFPDVKKQVFFRPIVRSERDAQELNGILAFCKYCSLSFTEIPDNFRKLFKREIRKQRIEPTTPPKLKRLTRTMAKHFNKYFLDSSDSDDTE